MIPTFMRPVLLASWLLLAAIAAAQQPQTPIPSSLDEMIAAALRANPEIVLAEAKLRQAQAELNQVRLQVTRDVVTAFNERHHREGVLAGAARALQDVQKIAANGVMSKTEVDTAKTSVSQAEMAYAQTDAEVRYLLGIGSQLNADPFRAPGGNEPERRRTFARPDKIPESLVQPLGKQISGPFLETKTTLADLMKRLSDQAQVSILVDPQAVGNPAGYEVSLTLREPVTLTQIFQALVDQHDLVFILRDYGILATSESRAMEIRAPAIPSTLRVNDDAGK
jgi:hypothetical protein